MRREGKIISVTNSLETANEEANAKALLETELYLNDEVATEIFKKFGVFLRFHI